MKRVKRWRYYCGFCKKSGASGGHMKSHEESCCRNPSRVCGMCQIGKLEQRPIKELVAALGEGYPEGVERLRDLSEGCPVCMLAAIIQSKLQRSASGDEHSYDPGFHVEFDFKKERESFWGEVNREREEQEYSYY